MKLKLFTGSMLLTIGAVLALIYFNQTPGDRPSLVPVGKDLFITSQLSERGVGYLLRRGVGSLVDLRPDGEASDQPSSERMGELAKAYHIDFHYIPVPHEAIPESAVTSLSEVLSPQTTRTVLYCRSGNRAVRTFALVEASRSDGPNADAICAMVSKAGFSATDLRRDIDQRVAHRNAPSANPPDASPGTNR